MKDEYKEVYFGEFCERCKYQKLSESEEPCYECLDYPANENSHKPVKFQNKAVKK